MVKFHQTLDLRSPSSQEGDRVINDAERWCEVPLVHYEPVRVRYVQAQATDRVKRSNPMHASSTARLH
jgi:hypothetical protein